MSDLSFIVARLKEAPFDINIRAVDVDSWSSDERLQLLSDVVASITGESKVDVRSLPRDETLDKFASFLVLHKCMLVPDDEDLYDWTRDIDGKEKLYPLLRWMLSNHDGLRKRVYLSKFLLPVDLPMEMQTGGSLEEMLDAYRDLQADFVEVHKQYDFAISSKKIRPASEVEDDIKRLESERKQLIDRLHQEQNQAASGGPYFRRLLSEASSMRQAQDDEIRLEAQRREQLQSLAQSKRRLKQTRMILDVIKTCVGQEADAIISQLQSQTQQYEDRLESSVVPQRQEVELLLLQAEQEDDEEDVDIGRLEETAAHLEEVLSQKQSELGESLWSEKLEMLRQDARDAASQVQAIRKDLDKKRLFKELLLSTNSEIRETLPEEIQRPDGTSITRQELAEFQERVDAQSKVCQESKREVTEIKASMMNLKKEHETLTSQYHKLLDRFRDEEDKAGVSGLLGVNEELQAASEQTTSLNDLKSRALEDISITVTKITNILEGKKHRLAPKIDELKQQRAKLQELEKWKSDAMKEVTCLQEEWLEKERKYQQAKTGKRPEKLDFGARLFPEKQSDEYMKYQTAMFKNLERLLQIQSSCA